MKKKQLLVILPAVLVFAALTVTAWLLPLRPTVSEREKRELAAVPELSLASLLDGSYFADLSTWFSDTFPFRDKWIDFYQSVEQLYGQQDIMIYGELLTAEETEDEPAASPTPAATPAAPETESTSAPAEEEAVPEATEEPEEEIIEESELYTIDSAILIGDAVYPLSRPSTDRIERYASIVNKAAELLEGQSRVFNILLLNSTTICLSDAMKERIGIQTEEVLSETVENALSDAVTNVDTLEPLKEHKDEYIFFRTDHHWTQLGAYYVYRSWAEAAGFTPLELSECTEQSFSPFYGSLYYKAKQNKELTPDTVVAYTPPGDLQLFISESGDSPTKLGYEQPVLEDVKGTDKYMCFLRGDHALTTIVNNDIEDDSSVLLVKNSNGNPFSYFLTAHYSRVYVMDYRKYSRQTMVKFCKEYNVDDVIFLMSSGQAQGSQALDILQNLVTR